MSGNTGKMTVAVREGEYKLVSEDEPWPEGFRRLAVSYTLSYLRRIAKANGYGTEAAS